VAFAVVLLPRPEESAQPILGTTRHHVYVQMRDTLTHPIVHRHERTLGSKVALHDRSQDSGSLEHRLDLLGRQLGQRHMVVSWYQQGVAWEEWFGVQESHRVFIVDNDVRGKITSHDRTEHARH
jgi:hypothetical protein